MTQYLTVPVSKPMYVYITDLTPASLLRTVEECENQISEVEETLNDWGRGKPELVLAILVPLDARGKPRDWNCYVTAECVVDPSDYSCVTGFSEEETMSTAKARIASSLEWTQLRLNSLKLKQK